GLAGQFGRDCARIGIRLCLEHRTHRGREHAGGTRADELPGCNVSWTSSGFGDPNRNVDRHDIGIDKQGFRNGLAAEGVSDAALLEHDDGPAATSKIDAGDPQASRPLSKGDEVAVRVVVGGGAAPGLVTRLPDHFRAGGDGTSMRSVEVVDVEPDLDVLADTGIRREEGEMQVRALAPGDLSMGLRCLTLAELDPERLAVEPGRGCEVPHVQRNKDEPRVSHTGILSQSGPAWIRTRDQRIMSPRPRFAQC